MVRGRTPWPLPRWAWWVIAIAVWIGLAEGLPMLWESGGREAWQWLGERWSLLSEVDALVFFGGLALYVVILLLWGILGKLETIAMQLERLTDRGHR